MGPTGCPETSANIYQSKLRQKPEKEGLIYIAVEAWNHALYMWFEITSHLPHWRPTNVLRIRPFIDWCAKKKIKWKLK